MEVGSAVLLLALAIALDRWRSRSIYWLLVCFMYIEVISALSVDPTRHIFHLLVGGLLAILVFVLLLFCHGTTFLRQAFHQLRDHFAREDE